MRHSFVMRVAHRGILGASLLALVLGMGCKRSTQTTGSTQATGSTPSMEAGVADLDATRRTQLVSRMSAELEKRYVFPAMGKQMADVLRDHQQHGDYDAIVHADDFATRITNDLRAVSNDRHVMLEYFPTKQPDGTPEELRDEEAKRARLGFGASERLPGNIARIVIDSFEPLESSSVAVSKNLSAIADASALIIDLRDNHGGDPATVAWVASYLFGPEPIHLNDMYWHEDESTEQFWTRRDVVGARFGATKPVYLLVSQRTFSAAEEFAYDLQATKRAVIIGETTKGGAHPVNPRKLDEQFTLRVPVGRAINPITHGDWEGTGVIPDVAVDAAAAPAEALTRATKALGKTP